MDSFYDTEHGIHHFSHEEIKEYVIDDISIRFTREDGDAAEKWPWSAILLWFIDHYDGDFEVVEW